MVSFGSLWMDAVHDEWGGVKYLFLPDCFGRFSVLFYDQKKLVAKRKKIWKNIIEVRTTPPLLSHGSKLNMSKTHSFGHKFQNTTARKLHNQLSCRSWNTLYNIKDQYNCNPMEANVMEASI